MNAARYPMKRIDPMCNDFTQLPFQQVVNNNCISIAREEPIHSCPTSLHALPSAPVFLLPLLQRFVPLVPFFSSAVCTDGRGEGRVSGSVSRQPSPSFFRIYDECSSCAFVYRVQSLNSQSASNSPTQPPNPPNSRPTCKTSTTPS